MKQLFILFIFISVATFGQESETDSHYFQASYFYGNIIRHNKQVGQLLKDHPQGFILNWNKKNTNNTSWQHYNYPDFGYSFIYQDFKNDNLGESYSLSAHYNFYLLQRSNPNNLNLKIGFGLGYVTNPFDKKTNPKNVAFGTHLNANFYLGLNYKREYIFDKLGLNAGLILLHTSNGSLKSPNTGINVWAATLGVNYNLDNDENTIIGLESRTLTKNKSVKTDYNKNIKYNFNIQTGVNESDVAGLGAKPFFVFSAYVDKRLNQKSAIQFGSDLFLIYSMKDYIKLNAIVNENFKKGDFKRVGIFIGHELFISKTSLVGQLGYYVYYPVEFQGRIYERVGLKRYINKKWYATLNLKVHAFKAETIALGIGIRI
jgi:hypothetical protein